MVLLPHPLPFASCADNGGVAGERHFSALKAQASAGGACGALALAASGVLAPLVGMDPATLLSVETAFWTFMTVTAAGAHVPAAVNLNKLVLISQNLGLERVFQAVAEQSLHPGAGIGARLAPQILREMAEQHRVSAEDADLMSSHLGPWDVADHEDQVRWERFQIKSPVFSFFLTDDLGCIWCLLPMNTSNKRLKQAEIVHYLASDRPQQSRVAALGGVQQVGVGAAQATSVGRGAVEGAAQAADRARPLQAAHGSGQVGVRTACLIAVLFPFSVSFTLLCLALHLRQSACACILQHGGGGRVVCAQPPLQLLQK